MRSDVIYIKEPYHNYGNSGFIYKELFIWYIRKIFRKTNISYPMMRTQTCAYQGVNVSFSENFVNVLYKWPLKEPHHDFVIKTSETE